MILSVSIKNYALIKALDIDLSAGLNVITGETGAGKSIIIDALSLLLGVRANKQNIRAGQKKMTVSALFALTPALEARLAEFGAEDGQIVLSREIDQNGRNVCRVGGVIVPLALLKEIGPQLIDIHSQHEHVALFKSENQRALLDAFAQDEALLGTLSEQAAQLKALAAEIREFQHSGREAARLQEMERYQLDEIDRAALQPGEETGLEQDKKLLENGETVFREANEAAQLLSGTEPAPGILEQIGVLSGQLEQLASVDAFFKPFFESVQGAASELNALSYELVNYLDQLDFSTERLEEVEARLSQIEDLKRKYGENTQEILAYAEKLREKLDAFENSGEKLTALKARYSALRDAYNTSAAALSAARAAAAETFREELETELHALAMEKARVQVRLRTDKDVISAHGQDSVDFLISVNPGTAPQELRKVASGGELSRMMLSIKGIFGDKDQIDTMIFDEIDTGISGRTAQVVAEKISRLSRTHQIICITHLPQITAMADEQFRVVKESGQDSTQVRFERLEAQARAEELARMLGGAEVTETALSHAREMLAQSERLKQTQ